MWLLALVHAFVSQKVCCSHGQVRSLFRHEVVSRRCMVGCVTRLGRLCSVSPRPHGPYQAIRAYAGACACHLQRSVGPNSIPKQHWSTNHGCTYAYHVFPLNDSPDSFWVPCRPKRYWGHLNLADTDEGYSSTARMADEPWLASAPVITALCYICTSVMGIAIQLIRRRNL
jgi:hypothetical protein